MPKHQENKQKVFPTLFLLWESKKNDSHNMGITPKIFIFKHIKGCFFVFFLIYSYQVIDMKEIKQIIADNLICLRKKNNLTQNELADKLAYSDNMVSRWERAEVTPSVETLQKLSEFYNVPIEFLLKENKAEQIKQNQSIDDIKKFSIVLLLLTVVWFIITCLFVCYDTMFGKNIWKIFVLGAPISCLVLMLFTGSWANHIYRFVVLSVFIWSLLTFIYLLFLNYNFFLIYIVGVPAELALVVWAFIKPKTK